VRIGIHSGPVTAGVLRGERSRFQLFGNTMNVAARMEHTGEVNRIQVSESTAQLLIAAGKEHWLCCREGLVEAKGIGKIQTYWASVTTVDSSLNAVSKHIKHYFVHGEQDETQSTSFQGHDSGLSENTDYLLNDKTIRLIDWNVDILLQCLKRIQIRRMASGTKMQEVPVYLLDKSCDGRATIQEVAEIISLPEFDAAVVKNESEFMSATIDDDVREQLREYICNIATM
jgi:Adenylate and Guanylate cyclase catalytic domain